MTIKEEETIYRRARRERPDKPHPSGAYLHRLGVTHRAGCRFDGPETTLAVLVSLSGMELNVCQNDPLKSLRLAKGLQKLLRVFFMVFVAKPVKDVPCIV